MPEALHGWFMLAVQAALAVITVEQLRRRVFPAAGRMRQPELMIDVWSPLVVVLPMILMAARVRFSVSGQGWMPVGGPVCAALVAVGAALVVTGQRSGPIDRMPGLLRLAWPGSAAVLLMLAAANDLTMWMGQCAFAIGALLLWMNTPEVAGAGDGALHSSAGERAAGLGMTIALFASVGQGVIAAGRPPEQAAVSSAMVLATAGMAAASAASVAGPAVALRVGGWAGVYGLLLSLGVASLVNLVPRAVQAAMGRPVRASGRVTGGFSLLGLEAVALLLAAGIAAWIGRSGSRWQAVLGVVMIAAAAWLGAWRLAGH